MNETIIAVGNGGYNLATDLIAVGLFLLLVNLSTSFFQSDCYSITKKNKQ